MPVLETTSGPIEGRAKDGTLLFAGVPYAAPPVGALRFKAAQPPVPWQEVRAARRFGAAAPQIPTGGLTSGAAVRWDEDCLTLNITTPGLDGGRRPVLFWIHGGAYRTGQGAIPWYNGASFARNGDIVVVSINYRLGALGFTDLSRFGAGFETSGVNGLLDQIVAGRTREGKARQTKDFEIVHQGAGLWHVQTRDDGREVVSARLVETDAITAMVEAQIERDTAPDPAEA